MKKSYFLLIATITVLCFAYPNSTSGQAKGNKVPAIEKKTLENWVNHLSSDTMKGRKNGSPEMKTASEWIAGKFKEAGLKPFKGYKDYIQHYSFKSWRGNDLIKESNVIGYIEGSDPKLKKEYIVITAHFDHVGLGRPVDGDSIYNGANDNASGTCAVIAVAKTLNLMNAKPARSIIFAAFSGEELGMQGSRYFADHCPVPVASFYLNINFEMLGHCKVLGEKRFMITGPQTDNLASILHAYNKDKEWKLIDTVKNLSKLFFASDNISFALFKKEKDFSYGIPAHTFVIWNGEDHLHKPKDEAKYFNFDNYQNFIQYISGAALYLSDCKTPIKWKSEKFKKLTVE